MVRIIPVSIQENRKESGKKAHKKRVMVCPNVNKETADSHFFQS